MTQPNISESSLILAVDTATPVQSLAVMSGKKVLFEAQSFQVNKEGPGLLSLIDGALRHCGLELASMDRFVVSRGPGAFTGLRVSMALLKSFAFCLNRPLYAASSLEALALDACPSDSIIASCIDARRGEIYVSFYVTEGEKLVAISEELLLKPEDFSEYIRHAFSGRQIFCVGTAFPHYSEKLKSLCPGILCRPANIRASQLGNIILERFENDLPDVALEALEPKYIRIEDFALPKPFDFGMVQGRSGK